MKTNIKLQLLLVVLLPVFLTQCNIVQKVSDNRQARGTNEIDPNEPSFQNELYLNYLPTNNTHNLVTHQYYTVSYSEEHRQSEWVAYELSADRLNTPSVKRKDRFKSDPRIFKNNASPKDYSKTGYDRGHLAPAADMSFSQSAMLQSFYMSNMSPQLPGFNRGVWKRLEEQTRDWAKEHEKVVIITGPILQTENNDTFKLLNNGLAVPEYYYKILLDLNGETPSVIGFILKNEKSSADFGTFAVTLDEIERRTSLDFFPQLPDSIENKIEATIDLAAWNLAEPENFREKLLKPEEILADIKPSNTTDLVVSHDYYSFSYNKEHRQSEWVAYELSEQRLNRESVKRKDRFKKDPAIKKISPSSSSYKSSGYDRGHLAPAADMLFSKDAMLQSFYMTNMSPQLPSFNRGIWKRLEKQTRHWAKQNEHLYIVTGPILNTVIPFDTLESGISVPKYYYKAILDLRYPEVKAIAFVLENDSSNRPLNDFAITIDELEKLTDLDFFTNLPDELETRLESSIDLSAWGFNVQANNTQANSE